MTAGSWSTPWPTGCGPAAPGGCCPMTSALADRRPLLPLLAAAGMVGTGPRHPPHPGAAPPRPPAHPDRGHPGQPEHQDHRTGGRHGADGAKKVNGRKRHLLVDTLGLIIKVHLTAADVGDRDGAMELLRRLDRRRVPRLRHGWSMAATAAP